MYRQIPMDETTLRRIQREALLDLRDFRSEALVLIREALDARDVIAGRSAVGSAVEGPESGGDERIRTAE